ncbi:MAG TPA: PhoH family protein [Acidimicrobiales bacterium]|nr:PhoH family protein [Acidimicrobiales bacterium]
MSSTQVKISVPGNHLMPALLGERDEVLRAIEAAFPEVAVHVRGNEFALEGDDAERVGALIEDLVVLVEQGHRLDAGTVRRSVEMVRADERPSEVLTAEVLRPARGRPVRPKSSGQKRYVDAIRENVITFGVGPAGTGKSWLAVAMAVQALQSKQVDRIILTRPAVEAGERLGFLPGDLMAKVDPYLRPLWDALHDMVGTENAGKLLERGAVEVAPLAFMRGRAQPVDRRVLTPWGWRRIGELAVGDLVVGSDGRPTPVLGVFPQGRREVFRVRAQDGAETLACAEHLWFVTTPSDRRHGKPGRVVQTRDMVGRLRPHHQRRFELPLVSQPVEFEPRPVSIEPYALGLLLGDGCLTTRTTPSFTTGDPELAMAVEAAFDGIGLSQKNEIDYVLRREGPRRGPLANPVTVLLRETMLAGTTSATKFLPLEYLLNSSEVRLAVLQGLLDTDGGPVGQTARRCGIHYRTCSPQLHDDVVFLVRSLGGVAYSRVRPAAGRTPGLARGRAVHHRQDAYILDIRLPAGIEPFRLERKAQRYRELGAGRPMRFVDSIEPAGVAETVCIQVGAGDSLYVTDDFLVTHNTLNSSFIILDEAQNTTPEQMKMFLTRIGFGSKAVVTGDTTQVDVAGGRSGLGGLERILTGIDGLGWVHLTSGDVVRHRIVQDIVDAYERAAPPAKHDR